MQSAFVILEVKLEEEIMGLDNKSLDKIRTSVAKRKPAYLAILLVDILKYNGWSPDDVHFLGSEIINESGVLQ
jgi:hypothetical protein